MYVMRKKITLQIAWTAIYNISESLSYEEIISFILIETFLITMKSIDSKWVSGTRNEIILYYFSFISFGTNLIKNNKVCS